MTIDETAPVIAKGQTEIAADGPTVWNVLTGIANWPDWNPDVKSASMMGELVAGTTFRWTAGPATITSTLQELDPPRLIAWTGKTSGIKAVHVHRLDDRDGTTVVTSEESWNGWLPRLMRGSMRKRLQGSIEAGLRHLKAEAERRAAQTSSS